MPVLQLSALNNYVNKCATHVAPSTMLAIIMTESSGNQLAIGLNHGKYLKSQPHNLEQAKAWVSYLEQHGYNFDIGLAQVNVNTVHRYGYSAVIALNPCVNLKIASTQLYHNYTIAYTHTKNSRLALYQSISAYNTGNFKDGFYNKYIIKVVQNAKSLNLCPENH